MSETIKATADLSRGAATVNAHTDVVRLIVRDDAGNGVVLFLPAQARDLAAALLRAADEAESGTSEEARLRMELAAVDDALRSAGIEYPLGARGVRDLAGLLKLARKEE
ncbi:hypothetical protein [Streptomyces sp. NPDC102264]|uniref:hypothetical protein n=1 Tax=Streptomyces sp. NPDC102264 TaxID=3366149 RepID=UPI00382FF2E3